MKKILITLNTYTNYQFDFYKSLKKFYSVKIFFLDEKSFNYKFKYLKKNDYFYQKQISFKKLLLKENPDFVFFGGVKHAKLVNFNLNSISIKYFFWLERLKENFIRQKYYQIFYRRILSKASGILAVGNEAKLFYSKFNKITYNLQYCINISKYKINNDFKKNKINFLYVGQLIKRKGIDNLIKSIPNANNSNCSFTFVGNGPLKKKVLKLAKQEKNVFYHNFLNKNNLDKVYKKNNILILPSKYDGWGVVVIEAMARGMALISNKSVGAASEYIKHNFNGRLYNINKSTLESQIIFFQKNPNKINIFGNKNFSLFQKNLCNTINAVRRVTKIIK